MFNDVLWWLVIVADGRNQTITTYNMKTCEFHGIFFHALVEVGSLSHYNLSHSLLGGGNSSILSFTPFPMGKMIQPPRPTSQPPRYPPPNLPGLNPPHLSGQSISHHRGGCHCGTAYYDCTKIGRAQFPSQSRRTSSCLGGGELVWALGCCCWLDMMIWLGLDVLPKGLWGSMVIGSIG